MYRKTVFELTLDRYDVQARRYYKQLEEQDNNAPQDVKNKRKDELSRAKDYLDLQRRNLHTLASIQSKLDEYREEGRIATKGSNSERRIAVVKLRAEGHHPTSDLEQFMRADGNPKPSTQHTAHHIVPGKGRLQAIYQTRVHMHIRGIRINDPDNGVWLPSFRKYTPHWSMPQARGHLEYHTNLYETQVARRVQSKRSEQEIRTELKFIGKLMQSNQFPTYPEKTS